MYGIHSNALASLVKEIQTTLDNPTLVNPELLLIRQTFYMTDFHFSVFTIFDIKPTI